MNNIKNIIKERLKQTKSCEFKKAWVPKGWAVVNVDTFTDELTKLLEKDASVHTTDQDLFLKFLSREGRIGKYNTKLNSTVDVEGDVNLFNMELKEIPVKFGIVTGYFNCSHNQLTSLEGAPEKVGEWFDCSRNRLTSLIGCPIKVAGFYCHNNIVDFTGDDIERAMAKQMKLVKDNLVPEIVKCCDCGELPQYDKIRNGIDMINRITHRFMCPKCMKQALSTISKELAIKEWNDFNTQPGKPVPTIKSADRHTFQTWWDGYFEEKGLDQYCIDFANMNGPVFDAVANLNLLYYTSFATKIAIKLRAVARDAYIAGAKEEYQHAKNNSKN